MTVAGYLPALQAESGLRLLKLMAEYPWVTFTLAVLFLFLLFIARQFFWQHRRGRQLSAVAERIGFSFRSSDDSLPGPSLGRLPWFTRVQWKKGFLLRNVLRGTFNRNEALVFDCKWYSAAGSHDQPEQTVACFHLRGRFLPDFVVVPENTLAKFSWSTLGYRDINLEAHPEFSRRYLLRGPDEAAVRSLFSGELAEFLGQERDWNVLGSGEWVAMFQSKYGFTGVRGMRPLCVQKPENIPAFVEKAGHIAALLAAAAPTEEAARAAAQPAVRTFQQETPLLEARMSKIGERLGWIMLGLIGLMMLIGLVKVFILGQ